VAAKDPKMSRPSSAGKRKHITLMIPEKLDVIRRRKWRKVTAGSSFI